MRSLLIRLVTFLTLMTASTSPVLAQGGVTVSAEADRTTVSPGDEITLTVTVAGDYQQLSEPELPPLTGFNVTGTSRSSQFSMVNGEVNSRTLFVYRLQPAAPGTYVIEVITVRVNGLTYQTDPITVEVTQGAAPTAAPSPLPESGPAPDELAGQDLFVEADVDNAGPYVGAQIVYRFRFYQAASAFGQPRLEWPSFDGFWTEPLSPNNVYQRTAAGRQYRVVEVRQALFPTRAGGLTIAPTRLTIPGDLLSREIVLETEAVVVQVRALPESAPEGFAGAVGQYTISAHVEPQEAHANEPVSILVRVQGTGNLTILPDPTEGLDESLTSWRVYDTQTTTDVNQEGETIRGAKLFERLLVPKVAGELGIPSFALTFFDPQAGEYRRVETAPITVMVAPGENVTSAPLVGNGSQGISVLGTDIRHIKAAPNVLATERTSVLEQPIYWLMWLVPPFAVAGLWVWDRRRQHLAENVTFVRFLQAHRAAKKRLAGALKRAQEDPDTAYGLVAGALNHYAGDKLNLPPAGLTRDTIAAGLATRGASPDVIDHFLACLEWADTGRFAPVAAGRSAGELVAGAEEVVARLEAELGVR